MFKNSDVYLRGNLEVDSVCCTGQILFEDLGNRFENDEHKKMDTGMSNLYEWTNSMIAKDLLIDGNIIFNEGIYSEEEIFEKIKLISNLHPKMMTIRCDNFLMSNKIISKDNYIHTTNNEVLGKLRKMKIKKIKNND
jgi:hypothetical protein